MAPKVPWTPIRPAPRNEAGLSSPAGAGYDYINLDDFRQRVLAGATGKFAQEFDQAYTPPKETLAQTQARSVGTVRKVFTTDADVAQRRPLSWLTRVLPPREAAARWRPAADGEPGAGRRPVDGRRPHLRRRLGREAELGGQFGPTADPHDIALNTSR